MKKILIYKLTFWQKDRQFNKGFFICLVPSKCWYDTYLQKREERLQRISWTSDGIPGWLWQWFVHFLHHDLFAQNKKSVRNWKPDSLNGT